MKEKERIPVSENDSPCFCHSDTLYFLSHENPVFTSRRLHERKHESRKT
ncbi:hypothetical protein HMPREF9446_02251 [Bacteroides fluxus YIT 12057]|uniref:Uncharacterized protein n=1 Tax=Bacteroides fluxus YIT 12057 TaxID=763034 RepID=F3PU31_9BACE|nr:hypothetical protein HMPREF9446_02251 [Bacteroides fluxus YIT 12057]